MSLFYLSVAGTQSLALLPHFFHFPILPAWMFLVYAIVGWIIRASMIPAVLARQLAPGASWAWLGIVFLHPYIGLALYLLVGETRLSRRYLQIHRDLAGQFRSKSRNPANRSEAGAIDFIYQPMVVLTEKITGMPLCSGNALVLFPEAAGLVERMAADIDGAREQVHLLYYIWGCDHTSGKVADALKRAAGRGVKCRLLVDAVGSRAFLRGSELVRELREANVEVTASLPVGSIREGLPRMDLRNHRKLAVIDSGVAYAGSHNMINADYGGVRAGPWVDLTGRLTGPIVGELESVFFEGWAFETGRMLEAASGANADDAGGNILMQTAPTGPTSTGATYRRIFLAAIQSARKSAILTTPYFVPDETTLVALIMAADRGVNVKLIVPERADHLFTAAAGRAHFSRLMEAGIEIHQFAPGLLHAKTVTVDDAFAVLGSANLDVRSFNINFELSVLMYGKEATDQMKAVQLTYLSQSHRMDPLEWSSRSIIRRYAEGAVSLISPLL